MHMRSVGTIGASRLATVAALSVTENSPKMSPEISRAVPSAWSEAYFSCWFESR